MNGNNAQAHHVDVLAALLLLCAFAMCILSVLLAGTRTYRDLTARDREDFEETTQALYVTTKVRQAYSPEEIEVRDEEGVSCLVIRSLEDGEPYLTRVYQYDGWIRELFTREEYDFSPEDGEKVSESEGLSFDLSGGILTASFADSGRVMYFSLKEGGQ